MNAFLSPAKKKALGSNKDDVKEENDCVIYLLTNFLRLRNTTQKDINLRNA